MDWVEEILRDKFKSENIDKNYILKFINCNVLTMDKTNFIYNYGSENAKRIFVDYNLSY